MLLGQESPEELSWDGSSRSGFFSLSHTPISPGRTLPARVDALIFACPVRGHVAGWVTVHRWLRNLRGMAWGSTRGILPRRRLSFRSWDPDLLDLLPVLHRSSLAVVYSRL